MRQNALGEFEGFFINLLSLGRRLDWTQLAELMRRTDGTKTVGEYAHLSRVAPDQLPLIYAAALFSDSSDRVAAYLIAYGKTGLEDLKLALSHGQGAVRLLLTRVPVNRTSTPAISGAAELPSATAAHAGAEVSRISARRGLALRGLDRWLMIRAACWNCRSAMVHIRRVLATVFALIRWRRASRSS